MLNSTYLNWKGLPAVILVLFSITVSTAHCADAIQILKNKARTYYYGDNARQDYGKALALYLKAANLGDAEAQYIAGAMYFKGLAGTKDLRRAFTLLHRAALQGKSTPESEKIIGQAFLLGSGVPKNYSEARRWYSLAAAKGDNEAQNELGYLYFTGKGVKKDPEKALKLFLQSATNGLAIAQYNLGILYYTGNGVQTADLKAAYSWMNIAAANGHKPAVAARDFLETVLSADEIREAQEFSLSKSTE